MPAQVAILTPASLRQTQGTALRPLWQAKGLWEIGFRDFVLFSPEPDPSLPFAQEKIAVRGPADFVTTRRLGCALVHAHQNAGLWIEDARTLWVDFHGFAPLESRENWRRRPWSPRAAAHWALTFWATRRLFRRAGRILCASDSIAQNLRQAFPAAPPAEVVRNTLNPEEYRPTECPDAVVGVVGGFASRWGRPAFAMALEIARLCPALAFRLVGALDGAQRAQTAPLKNVEILGPVDSAGYSQYLRGVSIALLPYPDWCIGGGSRLKLLQAAASAQAVVSTPAGVEGYSAPPETKIGAAPAELAQCLMELSRDPAARRQNAQAQRAAIARDHDWKKEATRLAELYDQARRR